MTSLFSGKESPRARTHSMESENGHYLTWERSSWTESALRYHRLSSFASQPDILVSLGRLIDLKSCEKFSDAVASITSVTGNIPAILRALIDDEVSKTAADRTKGSILRGNSLVNRLQASYIKSEAREFLVRLLGSLVSEIVADPQLSLEVDPSKIKHSSFTQPPPDTLKLLEPSFDHASSQPNLSLSSSSSPSSSASSLPSSSILSTSSTATTSTTPSALSTTTTMTTPTNSSSSSLSSMHMHTSSPSHLPSPSPSASTPTSIAIASLHGSNSSSSSLPPSPEDSFLLDSLSDLDPREASVAHTLIENQNHLLEIAGVFLQRICSPGMVEAMPSPLRVMAGLTAEAAQRYQPDMIRSLLGGFIMLRVIAPAVVSPEQFGIAKEVSPTARRNLILIAKLLQNAANNVEFGEKEEWMTFANPFIRAHIPTFNAFLDTISSSLPGSSFDSAVQSFDIQNVNLHDLFIVHDAFYRHQVGLLVATQHMQDAALREQLAEFLHELGPSPIHLLSELEGAPSCRKASFGRKTSPASSSSPLEDPTVRPMSSAPLLLMLPPGQDLPQWTEESLAETMFFYNGQPTIDGLPSLYLIVNRIQPSFFNSVDAVISHLYRVMERLPNAKYVLVVDLSWSVFTDEMKKGLRTYIEQLRTIFSRRYKKNLHRVFLIHPSASSRGLILLVKAISSIKLDVKFVEIDEWQELLKHFHSSDILLPESSKSTITKAYSVKKVNAKGKEQRRLIKFTLNSLLNIDPAGVVTNEKLLAHILSVSIKLPLSPPYELMLRFCPDSNDALAHLRKKSIHRRLRRTTELDQMIRKYMVESPTDLQAIIEEIFQAGFLLGITSILPQEYPVIKVNPAGKAQQRIFKLTGDSLLNLNRECKIRDEISFAGIEMVELDSSDKTILWLKKKTEPRPRKIISKDALSLYRVLSEGIERYKAEQPLLLRTLQR